MVSVSDCNTNSRNRETYPGVFQPGTETMIKAQVSEASGRKTEAKSTCTRFAAGDSQPLEGLDFLCLASRLFASRRPVRRFTGDAVENSKTYSDSAETDSPALTAFLRGFLYGMALSVCL